MTNTNTNTNTNANDDDDDAAESLLNGLESESASTPPRVHAAFWRVYTPPLALLARRSPEERDWSPGATLASTPPLAAWRRRDRVFSADVSGDFADDDAIDPGLDETRPALDQKSLHRVHAADLTGLPAAGVKYALRHGRCEGAAERGEACVTLLVAPVTAVEGDDALADAVEAVRTFGPHFSGEEMDAYVRAYRTGALARCWRACASACIGSRSPLSGVSDGWTPPAEIHLFSFIIHQPLRKVNRPGFSRASGKSDASVREASSTRHSRSHRARHGLRGIHL